LRHTDEEKKRWEMSVTYFSAINGVFRFSATLPAGLRCVLALVLTDFFKVSLGALLFVSLVRSVCAAGWGKLISMWTSAGDVE
jgi:hypothetical protein